MIVITVASLHVTPVPDEGTTTEIVEGGALFGTTRYSVSIAVRTATVLLGILDVNESSARGADGKSAPDAAGVGWP